MRYWSTVAVLCVALGCGSASDPTGSEGGTSILDSCSDASDCPEGFDCLEQVCQPLNCQDLMLTGNETDIDCGGDCLPCTEGQACLSSVDCASLYCSGDAVCRDCSSDADCAGAPGTFCNGGRCTERLPAGSSCERAGECSSGYCVDDVCCDGPCDGNCQTCNSGGMCVFIAAGGDSEGDCSDEGGCGFNGLCDGEGGCQEPEDGANCTLNSCNGGGTGVGTCASGACTSETEGCGAYECDVDGVTCLTSCGDDGDCSQGYYCDGNDDCVLEKANGEECSSGNECSSGQCVDGVCCNNDCSGECESCLAADTGGTDGTCSDIRVGEDPYQECEEEDASTCGKTGVCGGNGCALYSETTQCASQQCSNGQHTGARFCDGDGTCSAGNTSSCFPYTCNGNVCYRECTTDAQCIGAGYYCDGRYCQQYDFCEPYANIEQCEQPQL